MDYPFDYDVIVVGGGHAGTEAALASARVGARTLLLTHQIETVGQMSCNPAIGGIGKGHLVREIDALGGLMARAADHAGIQFRILNARKGPAVRATRAQADRDLYRQYVRHAIENARGLTVFQQPVGDLLWASDGVSGVVTEGGVRLRSRAVVLTTGTFLNGVLHVGAHHSAGGRVGDPPSVRLASVLRERAYAVGRLKTGTPPRLDGRSIDYRALELQPGDTPVPVFSYLGSPAEHPRQIACHLTRTNPRTHDIIRANLARSPMYSGAITGTGPRYCPSVEDKVVRFADKDSHQVFLEPEGLHTHEVYPNGISTSLPFDVQWDLVRSIAGLENAHLTRPGYAIEYDFIDPRGLQPTLETKTTRRLFFAGQINGTTGYEEAAAQGLLAGLNAARLAQGLAPWWPRRDEAYLGVLVDDLTTQGASEPYRMFTSRAEYRLWLREDNADVRLTPKGRELGLVDDQRFERFSQKHDAIAREHTRLAATRLAPAALSATGLITTENPARDYSLLELLRRPDITYEALRAIAGPGISDPEVVRQLEIDVKYEGYVARQSLEAARTARLEHLALPGDLDYQAIQGLSLEARQQLSRVRPATLGQASRLGGVTPATLSLLLVHLRRRAG